MTSPTPSVTEEMIEAGRAVGLPELTTSDYERIYLAMRAADQPLQYTGLTDVERVAEALWRAEWAKGHEPAYSWDALCAEDEPIADAFRTQARAAIAAMPQQPRTVPYSDDHLGIDKPSADDEPQQPLHADVEQVAQAIHGNPDQWDSTNEVEQEMYCNQARRVRTALLVSNRSGVEAIKEALSDDECTICGKTRSQHHTGSGVGMCQIYPIFTSRRAAFSRLVERARTALNPPEKDEQ